jgi:hypothetical protein
MRTPNERGFKKATKGSVPKYLIRMLNKKKEKQSHAKARTVAKRPKKDEDLQSARGWGVLRYQGPRPDLFGFVQLR